MRACPACGAPSQSGAHFCAACGQDLAKSQVTRVIRIGREFDNDICVPEEYAQVSRYQAVVRVDPSGALSIEDLGTANGTHVNDEPLKQAQGLQAGDTVRFGSFIFDLCEIERFLGASLPEIRKDPSGRMEPTAELNPGVFSDSRVAWTIIGGLVGLFFGYFLI